VLEKRGRICRSGSVAAATRAAALLFLRDKSAGILALA